MTKNLIEISDSYLQMTKNIMPMPVSSLHLPENLQNIPKSDLHLTYNKAELVIKAKQFTDILSFLNSFIP